MALAVPTSSVATTSASCLSSPQLPLIRLHETVAKINMPTAINQNSSSAVSNEPVYNLTISNGEIIHTSGTSTVPKIAVPPVATLAGSIYPEFMGKKMSILCPNHYRFQKKIQIQKNLILKYLSDIHLHYHLNRSHQAAHKP
ncbi:hypothetical protein AVEN_15730-1 [Araneus ventricosus]|uniref:Uncharacterized protein n=1 Tax=Araneus ventricosus TaxID=182803 RepID=A0A4Y2SY60_ARAVE|nr:hypothetical protein AVEN_15730-1 [Araneus ventricosus]